MTTDTDSFPRGNATLPSGAAAQPSALPLDDDALTLAARIVRGDISAVQAMQHSLAAIARHNPRLNAVCHVDAELGLRGAAAVDARLAACRNDAERALLHAAAPFLGVPLLLKDLGTAAIGLPSRLGSRLTARIPGPDGQLGRSGGGIHWPIDAELVTRQRAAGFVLFGRSASPEMGASPSTEAVAYGGPTRNPFSDGHSAGGSSGGAAAAVAGGLVHIAHANDGAGSIRIPASCCGLVGLKPSRGLMPAGPLVGESWGGLVSDHMLTRSVRDSAAALLATAGADPGAPYAAPEWRAGLSGLSGLSGLKGLTALTDALARAAEAPRLRIALCDRFFEGDPLHPEVAVALHRFATRLERLGHHVVLARPPLDTRAMLHPLVHVVACGLAMGVDRLAAAHGPIGADDLEPVTRSAVELGRRISGTAYLDHLSQLHDVGRTMGKFFAQHDLLLTAVLAEPPAPLGRWAMSHPDYLDYRLGPEGLWRYSPFAPLANATGGASLALPAGHSAGGLPIGAMLTGSLGDDARLLQLAAELEATSP